MFVWVSRLLLALNALSFIPQFYQLYKAKSMANTPLVYILFNVISATEQCALCNFFFFVLQRETSSPLYLRMSQEWNHLYWVAMTWRLLSVALFMMAVYYASGTRWRKSIAIFICLFVSDRLNRPRPGRAMSNLITTAIHLALFVTPAVTCASLYGLSKRIRPMKPDTSSVLSVIGLASQAFVHVALFISMLMLLPITPQRIPTLRWKSFFALYNLYGWALVDNAVYALIQGRLLWMALRNRRMGSTHVQDRGDGDTEKPQLRPPTLVLGQAFT